MEKLALLERTVERLPGTLRTLGMTCSWRFCSESAAAAQSCRFTWNVALPETTVRFSPMARLPLARRWILTTWPALPGSRAYGW